ncbi:hypothetical protein [Methylomonas methanica]|nr:hypothetical protein [Methylomonas methanica]
MNNQAESKLPKRSLLVVCNDVIGEKMAGPAIRCIEIAQSAAEKFDTTLVAPKVSGKNFVRFKLLEIQPDILKSLADKSDVVLIQGDALVRYPFLKEISGVLIADLYCPIPLEYHQVSDGIDMSERLSMGKHLSSVVAEQLAYADYFLCASEKQKDFWLGALTVMGRINGLRWEKSNRANINDLILLLPFGLPNADPAPEQVTLRAKFDIPKDHFVAVWGGGIYEWFDPLTIIKAIRILNDRGDNVHLVFIGVKHPNPGIQDHDICARAISLSRELDLLDRFVHFNSGWVDYETRSQYFMDANIGVSAHFDNPETRFSFRTRMLDYLWCNLPIVTTRGDYFGDTVTSEGLGATVNFEDLDGWVEEISRLQQDVQFYEKCSSQVANFKIRFRWENVTKPLLDIVASIEPSADREFARNCFGKTAIKPSLFTRVRHVYSTGGFRKLFTLGVRRIHLAFKLG